MTTNKRVILQQDLPGAMKGTEVLYDTERVLYYIRGTLYKWSRGLIEGDDGKWFKLEEILLEEKSFNKYRGNLKDDHGRIIFEISECGKWVVEYKGRPESQEKFEKEVKEATEHFAKAHIIKERDWEIMSLKDVHYTKIIDNSNKLPTLSFERYLTSYPKGRFTINSVKRLSDGEVFTIGDEANYPCAPYKTKITGFDIYNHPNEGKMCRAIFKKYSWEHGVYHSINEIKKSPLPSTNIPEDKKPVLFVTEDGVEIRVMDEYWSINIGSGFPGVPYWTPIKRFGANTYPEGAMIKQFSTERAAGEYIIQNRPYLSLEDVMAIVRTIKDGSNGRDARMYLNQKLHDLVKSKRVPPDEDEDIDVFNKRIREHMNEVNEHYTRLADEVNRQAKEQVESKDPGKETIEYWCGVRYTQQEIDTAREQTWEAARAADPSAAMYRYKFHTLMDYLKSLK